MSNILVPSYISTGGAIVGDMPSSVGRTLLNNNMDFNSLRRIRANGGIMPYESNWTHYDDLIIQAAMPVMNVFSDLDEAGLVIRTNTPRHRVTEWVTSGDRAMANVGMEVDSEIDRDLLNFERVRLPLPFIANAFRLTMREIGDLGDGINIQDLNAQDAARRVALRTEDMCVNGYPHKIEGMVIPGMRTFPGNVPISFTTPFNAEHAPDMLNRLIDEMETREFFDAPTILYLPTGMSSVLNQIVPDTNGRLLREHLELMTGIDRIKTTSRMPKGEMVLVRLASDTIDVLQAQDMITVEWDSRGGMMFDFMVLTILVPRIKARQDGKVGIVHATFQT